MDATSAILGAIYSMAAMCLLIALYVAYRVWNEQSKITRLKKEYEALMLKIHSHLPSNKIKRPAFLSDIQKLTSTLSKVSNNDKYFQTSYGSRQKFTVHELILKNKIFMWGYIKNELVEDIEELTPFSGISPELSEIESEIQRLIQFLTDDCKSQIACWPIKSYSELLSWLISVVELIIEESIEKYTISENDRKTIRHNIQCLKFTAENYSNPASSAIDVLQDSKKNVIQVTTSIEDEMENVALVYMESYSLIRNAKIRSLRAPNKEEIQQENEQKERLIEKVVSQ